MTFERDIFISYAHIDNLPLKEGKRGWIEIFHRALEVKLSQLMGQKPEIWRDQKLQGNDIFGDEIVAQFPKTAVMISILSPRYLKSEWCMREVKEFYQIAARDAGVKIGNKSRIFKVIKTAVPYNTHPMEIADTLGYEFYFTDSLTGREKELNEDVGGNMENLYWSKIDDIAHDIYPLLETLKQGKDSAVINCLEKQLTVFLADTGSDLNEQHDMIKRELMRFGYRVVPDSRLPFVASEFTRAVESFLDQSVLSIHLVGGSGGMVPEGSRNSIVAMQNQLAAKKSKTGDLSRMIWLLKDSPGADEQHKQFVHRLSTDDESQCGADLFETSIEDFKSAIHEKLEQIKSTRTRGKNIIQSVKKEGGCIFLAETNFTLQTYRENLKQELIGMGYNVFPDQPLPLVHEEFIKTVDNLLAQCGVAIHILGEDYGVIPDKTDKSVVRLQYERGAEKSRQGRLKRLVCVPLTCTKRDERMYTFIEKVRNEINEYHHPNDYIFEAPLNDIERLIFKKLREIEEEKRKNRELEKKKAPVADVTTEQGPPLVYLLCDRMDIDHIRELEDILFDCGCEVMIPVFDGKEDELIADHRENLKSCDAVLIYYGQGNDLWMRAVTRDLIKIAGCGRTCPLDIKCVFLAAPASGTKERFRSQDTIIINGMQGVSPRLMEPFLEKLRALGRIR